MGWFRSSAVLCCAVAMLGCGEDKKDKDEDKDKEPDGPSEWRSYGHDVKNTRFNHNERLITRDNVDQLTRVWTTVDTGVTEAGVTSTVAVVDGVAYFGDWTGKIHAVKAEDGEKVWTTQLAPVESGPDAQVNDSPFVTEDRVYVGGTANRIYAVDRESGEKLWDPEAVIGDQANVMMWSSPLVVDDTLIIGVGSFQVFLGEPFTFRGNIVGVNADSGDVKWTTFVADGNEKSGFGVSVWGSAAVDEERNWAYIGTGQAYTAPASTLSDAVVALDVDSGEIKWATQFTAEDVWTTGGDGPDHDVGASVSLYEVGDKEIVGAGDKAGRYFALDRETGAMIWKTDLTPGGRTGGVMASPAVADGKIYVFSNDGIAENIGSGGPSAGTAFCLDGETGEKLWETPMKPGAFGGIAVANGLMFFNTLDGVTHALDTEDGVELWSSGILDGVEKAGGGVTVADGRVFSGAGWDWLALTPPPGGVSAFALP